jgi:hypothetical protein
LLGCRVLTYDHSLNFDEKNRIKINLAEYSQHPKTGPSGIQMVIFRTLFESRFQMALAAILFLPFKNRTKKSGFQMVGHLFTI